MSYQIFSCLKFTINLADVGYICKIDNNPTGYSSDKTYEIIIRKDFMSEEKRIIYYEKFYEDRNKDYELFSKKLLQYKAIQNLKDMGFIFNI